MSDFFDKVTEDRDPLKKLLSKIPGFKGYVERGDRRLSDKLLRETIANEYEAHYQRISGLQRDLISQGMHPSEVQNTPYSHHHHDLQLHW